MSGQKLERLLNLTALLLDARRPLPASEIQQQLEYPEDKTAFRRAFERDKEELRAMGIPLRVEPVPGTLPEVDGYRIPREEYALRDPGLTTEELAALHLAASAVQVEGLPATEGLLKLGGLVTEGARDLGVHVAPLPADPNLARLFGAVASRSPVRLRYRDEERTIDPVPARVPAGPLVPHRLRSPPRGGAQLPARPDRGRRRPSSTGPPSSRRPPRSRARPGARGSSAPNHRCGRGSASTVRRRAGRCSTSAPTTSCEEDADGSVVVELPVTNRAAFRSFVLSFLEHAEILEPPELRDDLVAWLS